MAIETMMAATSLDAGTQAGAEAVATTPAAPDDLARFEDMMRADAPPPADGTAGHSPAIGEGGPRTLGDSILRSLDTGSRQYLANAQHIREVLGKPALELHARDMLKMQFEMLDASLLAEVAGKAISKTVQHVDQLTKLQ